jgi:hypothetical protein
LSYTFNFFLATTSIYQGKNMKGWSRIIINFVKWWLQSKRWLWLKTKIKEYKGSQNESNPPLYVCNESVHDNNSVTISKWMWHVNKHTKKEKIHKKFEGQTKYKNKFKRNIESENKSLWNPCMLHFTLHSQDLIQCFQLLLYWRHIIIYQGCIFPLF